jgi:hypothetical protein
MKQRLDGSVIAVGACVGSGGLWWFRQHQAHHRKQAAGQLLRSRRTNHRLRRDAFDRATGEGCFCGPRTAPSPHRQKRPFARVAGAIAAERSLRGRCSGDEVQRGRSHVRLLQSARFYNLEGEACCCPECRDRVPRSSASPSSAAGGGHHPETESPQPEPPLMLAEGVSPSAESTEKGAVASAL